MYGEQLRNSVKKVLRTFSLFGRILGMRPLRQSG